MRGIHQWAVNSQNKGQWCWALMFFICAQINSWVNKREAGHLRHHNAHYDVTVKLSCHDNTAVMSCAKFVMIGSLENGWQQNEFWILLGKSLLKFAPGLFPLCSWITLSMIDTSMISVLASHYLFTEHKTAGCVVFQTNGPWSCRLQWYMKVKLNS